MARRAGTSHVEDVVDAEVIEDEIATPLVVSDTPPRHIREALAKLL